MTDVKPAEVTSIGDRRRILELEAANEDLKRKLAQAMKVVKPSLVLERAGCHHFGTPLVYDREEKVECGECGATLNPYEVLRRIAHAEMNFCHQLNDLRKEAERLVGEVKTLKAARARLRRETGQK